MQSRVSHLLFSTISRKRLIPWLHFALFSAEASRSSRDEKKTDDLSDELFLRNLDFGNETVLDKADKADSKPFSQIPGRPLRDDRRMEGIEQDLFPDYDSKQARMSGGRSRSSKSSMAGEAKSGYRSFQQKIKHDFDSKGEDLDFLFGQREKASPADESSGSVANGHQEKGKGVRIGESLFQKLKLGGESAEEEDKRNQSTAAAYPEPESAPPEDADQIFKNMKETGLIPNAVAMLDGLCKDGLVQEAMKLFGLMREKGTIPEVVIYTAVVEGFCRAAKFDDAKRIFRKMQKNGVVPNAFSYSVLIQGLCKARKLEGSREFFLEMVESGHRPNGATFTGLVDAFCKEKGVKDAEDLVRSLCEGGYALDEKAIREHLDKKGPYSPMVWEAIFGKKSSHRPF